MNVCLPYAGKHGQWECLHDLFVSQAKDRADERGKDLCDADLRGMVWPAVLGRATDCGFTILSAIAKNPLRLAWLALAAVDQPCERRRDVSIEILSVKASAVGAKLDTAVQKIKDAFGAI